MSELSSEARELIRRVGSSDGPRSSDRARVKRRIVATIAGAGTALGGGGTIASGAPAAVFGAAAASKVTVSSVVLWLAIGAGAGSLVSAPTVVSAYRRAESSRAHAPLSAPARLSPQLAERPKEPPRVSSVEVANVAGSATPNLPVTREAPASRPPRRSIAAGRTALAPVLPPAAERAAPDVPDGSMRAESLAEETRLLQAAQRELARKNTSAALALLDEHAARFPRGVLAQERSAARVLALCDLGRSGDARQAAETFVRSSPESPLVPRLRASCAFVVPAVHDDQR